MKKLFLTVLVSLIASVTFAKGDYQDVVYLKNGTIIHGTIIEQVPNQSLKIETQGGNIFVYQTEDIEKITKEKTGSTASDNLNYDYVGGRKWYVSFGGGANIVGDAPFASGKIGLGYYLNPQSLLSIEFNGGSFTDKAIGSFLYTDQNGSLHNDGKINYDYNASLILLSWSHIKDLSDRFQWRIGPSVGLLSISGGIAFDPSGLRGEPSTESTSKSAFAFGVNTGITWNFSTKKRWFLDLGYKLYGHTGIGFEARKVSLFQYLIPIDERNFSYVGNQIDLTIGWRFGKAKQ
ncbi:MAG: hypothetical protein LBN27_12530 [Prevotellaceae bacterium]|jgi:hypothetical protein|nr:hypothetical protein [Prevotellaceae bacterium]